jgi:hypothetical protein
MPSTPIPNDVTIQAAPSSQFAIDLFDGWKSELPTELDVKAGKCSHPDEALASSRPQTASD